MCVRVFQCLIKTIKNSGFQLKPKQPEEIHFFSRWLQKEINHHTKRELGPVANYTPLSKDNSINYLLQFLVTWFLKTPFFCNCHQPTSYQMRCAIALTRELNGVEKMKQKTFNEKKKNK